MYTGAKASSGPRILVVRLGSMGDVIHALPAVASLKQSFPGSEVTWAVAPRWAALLEGNPFVDRVLVFDRRNLRRAWRELRSQRFDLAVDFQGLIQSALVAAAARPERLVGYHRSQAREAVAALFYSNAVIPAALHIVDRHLDLARAAGATTVLRAFPLPEGSPEGELPAGDFVLASPLAGWEAKQWPLPYYAPLAERLEHELGLPLVVNGPPSSAAALGTISGVRVNLTGVPGLIHATRRAAAVVGVDSGPLHLAAALGKPGVAIFGPTDPERNGPYGGSFAVLRSPSAVTSYKRRASADLGMRAIRPDEVFDALTLRLRQGVARDA